MSTSTAASTKYRPPSDMTQIWAVTQVELQRNFRRKRLIAVLAVVIIVCVLVIGIVPAVGRNYPDQPILGPYNYSQFFLGFVSFLAILIAVFFGGDALVSEFYSRTGYSIFPNPVKRSSIFLGKVLASLIDALIVLSVFYLIIAGSMAAIYHTVPAEMAYSFFYAFMYVTAILGVAYFISSIMKTTTSAMVLTFFLFLFIMPIVQGVLMFAQVKPEGFLTFEAGLVTGFMQGPYPESFPTDTKIPTGSPLGDITVYAPTVVVGTLVILIWMIVTYSLAYYFFRRRDMLG